MSHVINTKYNPASGNISATCWRKSVRHEAYTTKAETGARQAHRAAAEKLIAFLNADRDGIKWVIIADAESYKANEYVFIIDTVRDEGANHYRVTWGVDVYANSYNDAARIVAARNFQQRIAEGAEGSACVFDVARQDEGWKDQYPVVVDMSKL